MEKQRKEGFVFKKSLGQNFIFDKNLLAAIVADAGVEEGDNVLEIGAGMGSLTIEIAKKSRKVLSVEMDKSLALLLRENLLGYENVQLVFSDFIKMTMAEIEKVLGKNYIVVANLPYYITTPIIFKFFEEEAAVRRIVVMVQHEVAKRIVAQAGMPEYGILSVQCQHRAKVKITRIVGRKNFTPPPNVDSAVVRLDMIETDPRLKAFPKFVRTCFSMKRKTLVNNLKSEYQKEKVEAALEKLGFSVSVRAEEISPERLEKLFLKLSKNNKKNT